uniref:transcription factor IIIB 50 kDa subunit-like isoform X1 n=1 Tax=Styela clava TaxID=7725 RepID=UPI0019393413|nr:transcription factor IIIB 50 kDa subunit-like isoform X1 [Styela clava]
MQIASTGLGSMASSDLCPDCKEGKLVEESMGAEETKTCTNCGYSTQSTNIVMPTSAFQEGFALSMECSLEQKYNCKVDSSYKQPSKNKKEVLNRMKLYLQQYPDHDNLFEIISTMYLKVVTEQNHMHRKMPLKYALAVACMVIVMRNRGISVLIPKLCDEFEIDVRRVMQFIAEIKPKFEIDNVSEVDMQTFVDNLFERNASLKGRTSLKDCTLKLVKLFYDLHLHSSRPLLASVALYYAILSESHMAKHALTASEYCRRYNVNRTTSFQKNVTSARTKLFLLAKRLPWAPASISQSNCHHYIKDILKAKNSLSGTDFGLDAEIPLEKNLFKRKQSMMTNDYETASKSCRTLITEQNVLELPPVSIKNFGKRPKVVETAEPVNVSTSEVIGEDEMSERELNDYIRSPEEIEVARKIQNLVS